jgi:predicted RNA-binding Zn-ribbon protein involved in translation (DUF1610 family)
LVASRACGSINSASSLFKTPLSRAERTPEVAAVSGVYREGRGELMTLPGIPRTNLSQASTAVLTETPGTPQKLTIHDAIRYYLDCIAQVATPEANLATKLFSPKCGQWFKIGRCKNGHRIAVQSNCRKPYCGICSDIEWHKTIARLYPKAQQLLPAALITIRPPNELQVFVMNRCARRRFTSAVIKALKSLGFPRGIIFVHFFGKDKTRYAFHLHVLVDGGWLEPGELDDLCRKLRRMIYPEWVVKRWGDKLAVNYSYKQEQAQVYQALDYCSRPTFTQLEGNERLADSIKRERKVRTWGKWDEEPKWHLDESEKKVHSLVALEKGKCPVCGEPIKWDKGVAPKVLLDLEDSTEIAAGYLLLPMERAPPEGRLDFTNLTELPDGDSRKHPNHIRKEIDRHRELISRRRDREFAS